MLIYDFFDIYDSQGKPGYDLEMFPLWNKVKKFWCLPILTSFGKLVQIILCLGSVIFFRLWLEGWCLSVFQSQHLMGKKLSSFTSSWKKTGLGFVGSFEVCGRDWDTGQILPSVLICHVLCCSEMSFMFKRLCGNTLHFWIGQQITVVSFIHVCFPPISLSAPIHS